jgi:hypothetical protein
VALVESAADDREAVAIAAYFATARTSLDEALANFERRCRRQPFWDAYSQTAGFIIAANPPASIPWHNIVLAFRLWHDKHLDAFPDKLPPLSCLCAAMTNPTILAALAEECKRSGDGRS